MIQLTEKEVISTTGAVVHRIGTECYGHGRMTRCAADTLEMFEELASAPAYRKDEYDATVAEMVRERYPDSDEFAVQRKEINRLRHFIARWEEATAATGLSLDEDGTITAPIPESEYDAYNAYVEQCKAKAPERIAARKATEASQVLSDKDEVLSGEDGQ